MLRVMDLLLQLRSMKGAQCDCAVRAVACVGWVVGGQGPQNFLNLVKFLGKMAARRILCIVDEIFRLQPWL